MVHPVAGLFALIAYLVATGLLLRGLRNAPDERRIAEGSALGVAALALALHAIELQAGLFVDGVMVLGLGTALSLFAWQCALLLVLLSLLRPLASLGVLMFPFAAASLLIGWLLPTDANAVRGLAGAIRIHVVLSLLAYGLLTIAATQAVVLAIQDRALHRHRPLALLRSLPPLQTMESQLFELMAGGLFLLTLALTSGLFFVDNLFAQHLAHKTILSALAWLVFVVLLWGRLRFGWRGRKAIHWTLGGYGVLILAYFGSKLVLELVLGTHWR